MPVDLGHRKKIEKLFFTQSETVEIICANNNQQELHLRPLTQAFSPL